VPASNAFTGGKNLAQVYKKYTKTFHPLHSNFGVWTDEKTIIVNPGESFTAPNGVAYYFFNPGSETIVFDIVLSPGFEGFEPILRIFYDGKRRPDRQEGTAKRSIM
jgi:hypothetical protein